ncbi:MAG TPA: hypothetical protein DIT25_02285 [Candidatus Moranbacteria bacterium]|nr:hypothetical protein [Candidatus Moranbacteria bacterium]
MSNLEPIEEADMDLQNKFIGAENPENLTENKKEKTADFVLEKKPEVRKEGAVEKEKAYARILSKVKTSQASDDAAVPDDAQSAHAAGGVESKIETLIRLASAKGVVHAVKVAKHLDDNYALDEFHDRLLSEELHEALVKKGLIREL